MYRGLSPAHQNHQLKGIEAKLVAKRHPVPDLWRDSKNNGALLIVAPKERKVRIEVGYGLEGELTDAILPNDNRQLHPAELQARRLQRRRPGRHHVDAPGARR